LVWDWVEFHSIIFMLSPVGYLRVDIILEIRIWGDGFGTVFGGFRQFRALSSGLRKPVVDIIPKSKDQFME
jgi:hypothetical protein